MIAFFMIISYVPYSFSVVFNNLIYFGQFVYVFMSVCLSVCLSLSLWSEELSLRLMTSAIKLYLKSIMLQDMAHEKCNKARIIMFSVRLLLIKRDVHFI